MANSTERIGVYHCGEIAESNNWMFREQPINDIGIDAHMEFVDPSGKLKQLLALQIKTGESWFREQNDGCVIFRGINERQYLYWTTNSLPCIVVLYNPKSNVCIWQKLTTETIEKTKGETGKGFYVRVPLTQVFLNDLSNEQLLSYTNLPEHVVNYNFLLSQKEFMQIIQDGGEVKLHSSEWVNKSSGKGETELIVDDGTKNIHIRIGFLIHRTLKFFLVFFLGQIFRSTKNFMKSPTRQFGENFTVIMIKRMTNGWL